MSKKARRRPSWKKDNTYWPKSFKWFFDGHTVIIWPKNLKAELKEVIMGYSIKKIELNTKTRELDPDWMNKIEWRD